MKSDGRDNGTVCRVAQLVEQPDLKFQGEINGRRFESAHGNNITVVFYLYFFLKSFCLYCLLVRVGSFSWNYCLTKIINYGTGTD